MFGSSLWLTDYGLYSWSFCVRISTFCVVACKFKCVNKDCVYKDKSNMASTKSSPYTLRLLSSVCSHIIWKSQNSQTYFQKYLPIFTTKTVASAKHIPTLMCIHEVDTSTCWTRACALSVRSTPGWLGTSFYFRRRNLLHQPQEQNHILAWPATWRPIRWVSLRHKERPMKISVLFFSTW